MTDYENYKDIIDLVERLEGLNLGDKQRLERIKNAVGPARAILESDKRYLQDLETHLQFPKPDTDSQDKQQDKTDHKRHKTKLNKGTVALIAGLSVAAAVGLVTVTHDASIVNITNYINLDKQDSDAKPDGNDGDNVNFNVSLQNGKSATIKLELSTDKIILDSSDTKQLQIMGKSNLGENHAVDLAITGPDDTPILRTKKHVGKDGGFEESVRVSESFSQGVYVVSAKIQGKTNGSASFEIIKKPQEFKEHEADSKSVASAVVKIAQGSMEPGCEDTSQGCYIPQELEVSVGSEVGWKNTDSASHTVTSGNLKENPNKTGIEFDSGLFGPGKSYTHTFEKQGVYDYFCMVHPWMSGTIIVVEE